MKLKVTNIDETQIKGVKFSTNKDTETYKETYFEWTGFPVVSPFKSNDISCGLLQGWHHTPKFNQIEYLEDYEQFYFYQGDCIMLFVDIVDLKPVMESAQLVYIPEGTQLDIEPNKGHFVAVATEDTFKALVIAPKQDSPRLDLPETIESQE